MLYVKPVPDVDILFTFVTVYLSVFLLFSYCLPVSGEIKLYIYTAVMLKATTGRPVVGLYVENVYLL